MVVPRLLLDLEVAHVITSVQHALLTILLFFHLPHEATPPLEGFITLRDEDLRQLVADDRGRTWCGGRCRRRRRRSSSSSWTMRMMKRMTMAMTMRWMHRQADRGALPNTRSRFFQMIIGGAVAAVTSRERRRRFERVAFNARQPRHLLVGIVMELSLLRRLRQDIAGLGRLLRGGLLVLPLPLARLPTGEARAPGRRVHCTRLTPLPFVRPALRVRPPALISSAPPGCLRHRIVREFFFDKKRLCISTCPTAEPLAALVKPIKHPCVKK